jgi:hypothetical protein
MRTRFANGDVAQDEIDLFRINLTTPSRLREDKKAVYDYGPDPEEPSFLMFLRHVHANAKIIEQIAGRFPYSE